MANRPTIGTGISNNLPCGDCTGTYCVSPASSCWHRTYNLGGDECKCFPEPGPTAGDGQPGTYPGWSGWKRKTSTQSTNTISISTIDGEIPVQVQRIAEIRYMDENDNVNSIPFPGYSKAQEIIDAVMDVNNIEPPSRIGLISSSPVIVQSTKPTKETNNDNCKCNGVKGCCGSDDCYSMNGYGGETGHACKPPGIQSWPDPTMNRFDKPLQSTTKTQPPNYQTIIGAYACGTEGAKACRILCEDVVTNNQDFLQGCCNPSSDFPRYRCPSTNATTCYYVGLWNGDSTHPDESVLVNTTYVCASSPAEACPTCSTTGGGDSGGGKRPKWPGRCVSARRWGRGGWIDEPIRKCPFENREYQ